MLPELVRRLSSLALIAILLAGGARAAASESGDRVTAGMLFAAGLIILGAWLAGEVRRTIRDEEQEHEARKWELEARQRALEEEIEDGKEEPPPPPKGKGKP